MSDINETAGGSTSGRKGALMELMRHPILGVLVVLVVIFVASALLSPYFLTPYNLSVVARGLAFVALVTIGQASLMILGELDLSLGTIGGLERPLSAARHPTLPQTPV